MILIPVPNLEDIIIIRLVIKLCLLSQSLPRVDALGSRLFLLNLYPELSAVPSALRPLDPFSSSQRTRAVDVGAGIGRVTADVLLHLVTNVVH